MRDRTHFVTLTLNHINVTYSLAKHKISVTFIMIKSTQRPYLKFCLVFLATMSSFYTVLLSRKEEAGGNCKMEVAEITANLLCLKIVAIKTE